MSRVVYSELRATSDQEALAVRPSAAAGRDEVTGPATA